MPIAQIRLVTFMADVAEEVGPGDGVGAAHEVGVCDGAEGFADFRGVGDVAMSREEESADAVGVGGVAVGGVCGVYRAGCS